MCRTTSAAVQISYETARRCELEARPHIGGGRPQGRASSDAERIASGPAYAAFAAGP